MAAPGKGGACRSVARRAQRRGHVDRLCLAAVASLDSLVAGPAAPLGFDPPSSGAAADDARRHVLDAVRAAGAPPPDLASAGAFCELRGTPSA